MRAVIVGGGIGGLAAAVAFRRVGIECIVLERAAAIREAGAGLSLWSNAVNALRQLGVDGKVLAAGSIVERSVCHSWNGQPITVNDFSDIAREAGAPSICVHRGVLQLLLLDELPTDWVRTSAQCKTIDGATAILENGERIQGDFLVGADGISSVVRAALHGVDPPRYAGYYCWRGICKDGAVLADRSALLVLGRGAQFGLWPCGAGQLYWFLTRNGPSGGTHSKGEAAAVCRGWAPPAPQMIEGTLEQAIVQNDIVDRPPLSWWGRGAVTLLGDAAHATTPNLGQGACQALEDAVVLARCLTSGGSVDAALREYERLRIRRTTSVVQESWRGGRMLQSERASIAAFRNWLLGTSLGRRLGMRMMRTLLTYRVPDLPPARLH